MAQWVQRLHAKGAIDRAGEVLTRWWTGDATLEQDVLLNSIDVVQNWRTSHAFPLNTFQVNLRNRARRVESDALVAQRLKRFSSMMNKLAREPQMKLSQMQDLGGCRAIMSGIEAVDRLFALYRGHSAETLFESEGFLKCYDYIREPKRDGYRGVHVVGRYFARREVSQPWDGYRIEVQLRSRLQHAFATTVETVTTFTREPLKFGGGPDEWKRFFSLMGSALAIREGTAIVPGTPKDQGELTRELREITKQLKVRPRLAGWARALKRLPRRNVKRFKYLLLVLNVTDNTIKVTGFIDRRRAGQALNELEKTKREDLDAVLVWVDSVRELKAAYPNYYADTGQFINALNLALRA